jgi:hypothetical protein
MPRRETIQKNPTDYKLSGSARAIESLLFQQIARDHDPLYLRGAFVDLQQLGVAHQLLDRVFLRMADRLDVFTAHTLLCLQATKLTARKSEIYFFAGFADIERTLATLITSL